MFSFFSSFLGISHLVLFGPACLLLLIFLLYYLDQGLNKQLQWHQIKSSFFVPVFTYLDSVVEMINKSKDEDISLNVNDIIKDGSSSKKFKQILEPCYSIKMVDILQCAPSDAWSDLLKTVQIIDLILYVILKKTSQPLYSLISPGG